MANHEGEREDDEEDACGMDEADGAFVGAALSAHQHHFGDAAGHAGKISCRRIEARNLAEPGHAQQRCHCQEHRQYQQREPPFGRKCAKPRME